MNLEVDARAHEYLLSTRKELLDLDMIHHYLSRESYWAEQIPREVVQKSIEHSICFGIYLDRQQIAFARLITDLSTFGYLADVFVTEEHRNKGLSKLLMQFIMDVTEPMHLRRFMLMTRDAHTLYEKFGFTGLQNPQNAMEISKPDLYKGKS